MNQGHRRSMAVELGSAQARLEAPRAAAIAGFIFSALFASALLILSRLPVFDASDEEVADWFASGGDTVIVIGALYLMPFAGIAFLWFLAVVRDQIGDREDRFFGTVFFGSGLLFVALLFAAAAIFGSLTIGVRYLDQSPPSAETMDGTRAIAYTLLLMVGSRAAALFMLSTATIGLRFGVFPRWFVLLGYAIGLLLLLVATFWAAILYVVPAWVALVSLFIVRRPHWARERRMAPGPQS